MSTGERIPLPEARKAAEAFRDLFAGTFERWEVAGSVRRCRAFVHDIEHVVIHKRGEIVSAAGLFATKVDGSLLWAHLDSLEAIGIVTKAVYGQTGGVEIGPEVAGPIPPEERFTGQRQLRKSDSVKAGPVHRWGEKYRGVLFQGRRHEIFSATPDTWGPILAIRTGPAKLSRELVTKLPATGFYRQHKGNVEARHERPRPDGRKVVDWILKSVPTEREYFQLCGIPYLEPEERHE